MTIGHAAIPLLGGMPSRGYPRYIDFHSMNGLLDFDGAHLADNTLD